jgi:Flp pilus assembly protein TadD
MSELPTTLEVIQAQSDKHFAEHLSDKSENLGTLWWSGQLVMKAAGITFLLSCCAFAQTHQHAPPPDQSWVDLTQLPQPQKIEGLGQSHIAITTKSSEAQQWFDQGLAAFHCFWDYEALRAFEQAVRLDSNCAMCHWGLSQALNFGGKLDQAKTELAKAKELSANTSDREQRIIQAFADSAEKKGDEAAQQFAKDLAIVVEHYPDDLEIRLLLARPTDRNYEKGDPTPSAIYSRAMLRDILHDHPENAAAHHYWIHAIEPSAHPEWALESAEKLGNLAPASGHMVHMPGHIFYRLGNYERARQIFLASKRVDEDYMARQHVSLADDWNYAHNLDYLIADCAEEGRYAEAREHARSLIAAANSLGGPNRPWFHIFRLGSTEARLAIRFADWDRVIEHPVQLDVSEDNLNVWERAYRDGLIVYARGMKAADGDRLSEAETQSTLLQAMLWRLSQEELDDKNKVQRDLALKILGTASFELNGTVTGYKDDLVTARKLLERADQNETGIGYFEPPLYSRPPLEVLGASCIRAGKFNEAREAYQKALVKRPHSGFALYGIALAWDKQGDKVQAARAYRDFLDAWSYADPGLPQIKAANRYLSSAASQ